VSPLVTCVGIISVLSLGVSGVSGVSGDSGVSGVSSRSPWSPWSPWSPQVMKRVRTEQIQHAVAQYLKRRQYVDAESPLKGAKLFQTPEEMAANLSGKEGRGVRFPV